MCRIWYSTVLNHDRPTQAYGLATVKKFGKYGREPFVRLEPVLPPPLSEVSTVPADHLDGGYVVVPDVEPGGEN